MNIRWIGYFDVSFFWLVVLLVVVSSMHTSSSVVFEDNSVLMENITNQEVVSTKVHCCGTSGQIEYENGVKTVLTTGGVSENESYNFCLSGGDGVYGVTEVGIVLILY